MKQGPSESFWQIIDKARAIDGGEGSAHPDTLKLVLDPLATPDVISFIREFYQALITLNDWKLWGAGYVIEGGMSDDSFHYFRSWIIGCGQKAFEIAQTDPDELGDFVPEDDEIELDNELLEYVGLEILEARGFEGDPRDDFEASADDEPRGETWDEETVNELFPKLAERFWD